MKKRILIVEDQFIEANNLQMILEKAGYQVCPIAKSVPAALQIVETEKPDLVLLDIHLKGNLTGIDLAKKLREKNIGFVFISANSNKTTLDEAKVTRPYGFLVKPFREKDLLVMLDIAWYQHEQFLLTTQRQNQVIQQPTDYKSIPQFHKIIGQSQPLKKLLHQVLIVAPTETAVLLLGESGTGKERIAEAIHDLSLKKNKPFVRINCAALPATLIESELFGHEKGAFTGAFEKRVGKFEQADGGTIFLDEVGEMPYETQAKLLRVLQEREIERIGGRETIRINVRIIAATNRNLEKEIAEGRFRMDLYYRLHVFPITLPPLRERKEDIPLLVNHFVRRFSKAFGKTPPTVSLDVLEKLVGYEWPGNIRELENLIERTVLLTTGEKIQQITLPEPKKMDSSATDLSELSKTIDENERDYIIAVLKRCGGKISGNDGAAAILQINASTLNSKIKKHGIQKEQYYTFMKP
ncbi:MAG TPA: sigma-54 dependent transcriptional regulator [Flavisolibacter sp.]|nr:sigma-54 dependent transcriptional regulator [Flavisolibacter sp.]